MIGSFYRALQPYQFQWIQSDPTSSANEKIAVFNKLRAQIQLRTDNLQGNTFSSSAIADRILTPLGTSSNTANMTQPMVACLDTCNITQIKGQTVSCSLCQDQFHNACVGISVRKNSCSALIVEHFVVGQRYETLAGNISKALQKTLYRK